jgi:hypothetical protein
MKLLVTGLGLLLLSLLVTVGLAESTAGPGGIAFLGWLAQTALYLGIGLVIAGAVLRALRPDEEPSRQAAGQDWFA